MINLLITISNPFIDIHKFLTIWERKVWLGKLECLMQLYYYNHALFSLESKLLRELFYIQITLLGLTIYIRITKHPINQIK